MADKTCPHCGNDCEFCGRRQYSLEEHNAAVAKLRDERFTAIVALRAARSALGAIPLLAGEPEDVARDAAIDALDTALEKCGAEPTT